MIGDIATHLLAARQRMASCREPLDRRVSKKL
jgi:hypothetical protein